MPHANIIDESLSLPYLLTSETEILTAEADGHITISRVPEMDFRCPIQPKPSPVWGTQTRFSSGADFLLPLTPAIHLAIMMFHE